MPESPPAAFPARTGHRTAVSSARPRGSGIGSAQTRPRPYPAVAGRYHLYVSLACPWAHRTIIYRRLKGLDDAISMTIVDPERDDARVGDRRRVRATRPDPVNGFAFLSEAYQASAPGFDGPRDRSGAVGHRDRTDRQQRIRGHHPDVRPGVRGRRRSPAHRCSVRRSSRTRSTRSTPRVYAHVNNGVYRAGFATTQAAYEDAFRDLFAALDALDGRLGERRYLLGDRITEADWRLFTTLVRFDPVYVGHFKCNLRRIVDYPNLAGYLRDLYQQPKVADTVNFDHIKRHYYRTHITINPTRIVPVGPHMNLAAPAWA